MKYRFGLFEADLQSGELRKSGIRIRIQAQPFRILAFLLEHSGQVVSREEIQERFWGTNTAVDMERSLATAIHKIRECLDDSVVNPRFIETVARSGYRFIAPVVDVTSQQKFPAAGFGASPSSETPSSGTQSSENPPSESPVLDPVQKHRPSRQRADSDRNASGPRLRSSELWQRSEVTLPNRERRSA